MKGQVKRSAVVATVLVFVCAAVYLNWRYAGNVADQVTDTDTVQTQTGENTKVLGEAALVGGEIVDAEERKTKSESRCGYGVVIK